jgi:mRNA interferase HigB
VHVITQKAIKSVSQRHPKAASELATWLKTAQFAAWHSIQSVRETYPSADPVKVGSGKTVTVFNIRRNDFRLLTAIHYNRGKVYILDFLTHAEYSKDAWKKRL